MRSEAERHRLSVAHKNVVGSRHAQETENSDSMGDQSVWGGRFQAPCFGGSGQPAATPEEREYLDKRIASMMRKPDHSHRSR